MAWTAPTPTQFKARFPAFAAVDDAVIQTALDEARMQVDETWVSETDFKNGINLLAAHILTLDGHGAGAEAEMAASGTLGFKVMRSGNLTLERFSASDAASEGGEMLNLTTYGKRFKSLRKVNIPAVKVV
ncbi:MAG: DUF4054 domain-containing protein [Parvibaculaceae bacterium]|nr:DUF4054 domain-containing protein [Parvibaculaceae bacterium]